MSEYLDTLGLVKSYFFKFFSEFFSSFFENKIEKNRKNKMSWCTDAPEDEAISLFAGLLANPDGPLRLTLTNISSINLVSIFRCSSSPRNPVYVRSVDSSALVFSLSSHRHSYIGLVFSSRFIDS